MQVCEQLWTEGCIWIAAESLKSSSLGIVSWAGKILITWRLSEQPPTTQIAALTLAKKKNNPDPLLRGVSQSLHRPKVNTPRWTWCPSVTPVKPIRALIIKLSSHQCPQWCCGLGAGLWHFCLWLVSKVLVKEVWRLGLPHSSPSTFSKRRAEVKRGLGKKKSWILIMYLPYYFSAATAAETMVPTLWLMSNMFLMTRMIQITERSK